jgi:hypothetical protein
MARRRRCSDNREIHRLSDETTNRGHVNEQSSPDRTAVVCDCPVCGKTRPTRDFRRNDGTSRLWPWCLQCRRQHVIGERRRRYTEKRKKRR